MKSSRSRFKSLLLTLMAPQLLSCIGTFAENCVLQFLPDIIVGENPVRRSTHSIGDVEHGLDNALAENHGTREQLTGSLVEINKKQSSAVVPDSILELVKFDLKACPRSVLCLLKNNGYRIILTAAVCDVRPELSTVHPRGYPPESTYKDVQSMFDRERKEIIVGTNYSHTGEIINNSEILDSVYHEIGHAIDQHFNFISSSSEFLNLYERDEPDAPANLRLNYYCQPGQSGPSETFAQVCGLVLHPSESPYKRSVGENFPSCYELVDELFTSARGDKGQITDIDTLIHPKDIRYETRLKAVKSNREGLRLLVAHNWKAAITKFEEALKIDPFYKHARQNLAYAHSSLALDCVVSQNLSEGLREFHEAAFLDPDNLEISRELNGLIGALGKKWDRSGVRSALGDEARDIGDSRGAIVEYLAALKIEKNTKLSTKLKLSYKRLNDNDKELARNSAFLQKELVLQTNK